MYPLPQEIHDTYADLLMWDDIIRYELYYGFPAARTVCVHALENGTYHAGVIYSADRTVPVSIWDDRRVDFTEVFS